MVTNSFHLGGSIKSSVRGFELTLESWELLIRTLGDILLSLKQTQRVGFFVFLGLQADQYRSASGVFKARFFPTLFEEDFFFCFFLTEEFET